MLALPANAELKGYWPLDELPGSPSAPNSVLNGTDASLFNNVEWVEDDVRGKVLEFSGNGGYADAGSIPVLDLNSDFTWSFWSRNDEAANTNVILGNRYNFDGGEFTPREFIKFTNQQFEFHYDGPQNVDYPDMPIGEWIHSTVVKKGNTLISYRNGLVNGVNVITATPINSQPLYFGGNQTQENWVGRLDDVAIWTDALPTSSVIGLAKGTLTPTTAPTSAPGVTYTTVFSENFSAGVEGKWNITNRGLQQNAEAGYDAPNTSEGVLTLGGTTNAQYWYGSSIESQERFSSSVQTRITVDRVSLTGTGTAFRSSLWILGDEGHYLHFSQNANENGWSWNANDEGGVGTLLPIGSGNNIVSLDSLDTSFGNHQLQLEVIPTGTLGEVNIFMYLDGVLVAGQGFSAFPEDFQIVLTGQARAIGDTVEAVFDNLVVQQVPEPSTALLLLGGTLAACGLRRRRR